MLEIRKASKSKCRIKLAVQGASGSGKSYSSLLLAFGLTGNWSKICVLDTENGSANLYADLGDYSVLQLTPPYSPESYIQGLEAAVKAGFECIVIDSLSHEWSGTGGILDIHSNIPGNSFTAWAKVTPRHNAFVQAILQADAHVIGTMRSKTDYVLQEKNGKQVPEKVGLKGVQREDAEYEFTLVFELNQRHHATVSKDRTGLFKNRPELTLTTEVGKEIAKWCGNSLQPTPVQTIDFDVPIHAEGSLQEKINACKTIDELHRLFKIYPGSSEEHLKPFVNKQKELERQLNYHSNGKH